ncbi:MAG: amidohydrolase family protein [Bacteroidetes bacterium]|nr:amidohydrolase family protein [Bacteroidota bacterium]
MAFLRCRATRASLLCAACLLALVCLPRPASAQSDDEVPRVTRTYALENARVVRAPGDVLERATVVVRDGLILRVGPDAAIPFDAQRIAADSLTVYAGFIDGLSHTGIPTPKPDQDREDVERPGDPPNDRAGIQPERRASAMLDASDSSIEDLREAGFTVAHVVPHGRMLPGHGAVILLAGDAPNALVVRDDAALFTQFESASGVYPATDMAVIAKLRQLYREAERRQRVETLYADNASGMERPAFDPVHQAFFPVLDGDLPMAFYTEDALDIHRALSLHRDLGFPLMLAGLNQSFLTVDALRTADAPLLLTLDLPEAKDDEAASDTTAADTTAAPTDTTATAMTPDAPESFFVRDFRTRSYEDVEDETKNLEARQAIEREKYYATAATLHEAGLRFGFTTMDVKPKDVHDNLRTMIEHGLPEDAALAALTTDAASALGLSDVTGTVEDGKMANLVVTDGPLFAEETEIRYVFVDGQLFEMETAPEATEPAAVTPAGTWSYEVETPQGTIGGVLTLSGEPDDLEGTITNDATPGEPANLEDVVVSGTTLSFRFDGGQFGEISVNVDIEGDTFEGSLSVPDFGGMPISGTRTASPDR